MIAACIDKVFGFHKGEGELIMKDCDKLLKDDLLSVLANTDPVCRSYIIQIISKCSESDNVADMTKQILDTIGSNFLVWIMAVGDKP